ncbi:MAG: 30S ribosomal protein S11 [bacterium]|nr:30S ribosomal protein S11 [bacterium]
MDGKTKRARVQKTKNFRSVPAGNAFIQATYNNTIITITDPAGNTIAWSSAGHKGFKGPKKATPYAASIIVKDAVEKAKNYNLREVRVFVKGVGSGRESAVRALNANGIEISSIKDVTPLPHNGPRPPRLRRV